MVGFGRDADCCHVAGPPGTEKLGTAATIQSYIPDLWLSPDGARLAYVGDEPGQLDVWILDLKRSVRTRFTFDPAPDVFPRWTPSGREIVFASTRTGPVNIFLQSADEDVTPRAVISGPLLNLPTGWSLDGRTLL